MGTEKRAILLAALSKFCPKERNSNLGFEISPTFNSSCAIIDINLFVQLKFVKRCFLITEILSLTV
jgi:hypothetical protein